MVRVDDNNARTGGKMIYRFLVVKRDFSTARGEVDIYNAKGLETKILDMFFEDPNTFKVLLSSDYSFAWGIRRDGIVHYKLARR